MPANDTPHTSAAGKTRASSLNPPITTTMYPGTISDSGAQIRPIPALNRSSGRPVMPASVTAGIPIEPNATGAVLASRQSAAA